MNSAQDGQVADPNSAPDALDVQNLRVTLRRGREVNQALKGVSLEIGRGEILALVGESGSGKSTLGLAAQGLLATESHPEVDGSILVDGQQIVGASAATLRDVRRHRLGVIFQDPMTSLNPTMTIGRQLQEAIDHEESAETWLDRVGIANARAKLRSYPHELSGGQRQRVMIAMAMCRRPALVLADEPTTALDVTVQQRILTLIRDLRDETGTAFLFVTHDLSVAAAIADRISVLYAGRLAEVGAVDAVMDAPAHPYTAALLRARFTIGANKNHQLPTLPSNAGAEPAGCLFAPRCLLSTPECLPSRPELMPVDQHAGTAACVHTDQVRPDLWDSTALAWPEAGSTTGGSAKVLTVVEVTKLYQRRGRRAAPALALRGVSLEVAQGESVALVGESGCGKSTLLRIVAGLVPASSGSVEFPDSRRPQMIYQDASASLTPWLSIGEMVAERLRRTEPSATVRRKLVDTALGRVGLDPAVARLRPHQLSGGQRQRVAVARAIVVPPTLLLCDEPVSAMDVSLAAAILNLLESLRRQGGRAMLFVTHDLAAARFVADRIAVMRDGQVVDIGPAEKVVHDPGDDYTRELLASMPQAGSAR